MENTQQNNRTDRDTGMNRDDEMRRNNPSGQSTQGQQYGQDTHRKSDSPSKNV